MLEQSFDWVPLAQYVHAEFGYAIAAEKYYLFESHVRELLNEHGFADVHVLIQQCRSQQALRQQLINAVTINETYFFRDSALWQDLAERIVPELVKEVRFSQTIRILICACSKGQEIYTLCMVLDQIKHLLGTVQVEILATDIDTDVLAYASTAIYSSFEVSRGLSPEQCARYFTEIAANRFLFKESLRAQVRFKQWNLVDALAITQRYDLIFCRNVLIYFDQILKQKVYARLFGVLNNYGYLCIGGSESALYITEQWQQRRIGNSSFLQKVYTSHIESGSC